MNTARFFKYSHFSSLCMRGLKHFFPLFIYHSKYENISYEFFSSRTCLVFSMVLSDKVSSTFVFPNKLFLSSKAYDSFVQTDPPTDTDFCRKSSISFWNEAVNPGSWISVIFQITSQVQLIPLERTFTKFKNSVFITQN